MQRFVVQEHHATSHHFDPWLERDGVLVSRATPRGLPEDTNKNRLAVRVEDHDLSHLDVVDETPVQGVPVAVKKSIWDGETYEAEEFSEEMVIVRLRGGRLDGRYAIFRAGENWPLHKIEPTGEA